MSRGYFLSRRLAFGLLTPFILPPLFFISASLLGMLMTFLGIPPASVPQSVQRVLRMAALAMAIGLWYCLWRGFKQQYLEPPSDNHHGV